MPSRVGKLIHIRIGSLELPIIRGRTDAFYIAKLWTFIAWKAQQDGCFSSWAAFIKTSLRCTKNGPARGIHELGVWFTTLQCRILLLPHMLWSWLQLIIGQRQSNWKGHTSTLLPASCFLNMLISCLSKCIPARQMKFCVVGKLPTQALRCSGEEKWKSGTHVKP